MLQDSLPTTEALTELEVSAHLLQLDAGIYCVYHSPGSSAPDPKTGLPGARLTLPPGPTGRGVTITGFRDDGWLGSIDSAALVRVSQGPAQVLMTIYQAKGVEGAPKLHVTKLVDGVQTVSSRDGVVGPIAVAEEEEDVSEAFDPVGDAEIAAHIQRRGDVLARLGDWVGERGSQAWVEGFALAPHGRDVKPEDIEYQAVLGRGWLSPWSEGTQYCGSRGMALPILGLRVRLRGDAANTHTVQVSGTFTDGTTVGPVGPGEACEAESLAPLEAFQVMVEAISTAVEAASPARRAPRTRLAASAPQAKSASPAKGTRR